MEKQRTRNNKISYTILCMIFSILFIFTALNIPITAYARQAEGIDGSDSGASLGQVLNLSTYSANETDESSNETAETEFIETPTTDTSTSSEYNDDENEIRNSEWADINGAWDAVHQYEIYAQENGADYAFGWTWCYDHGKGAGDQPSYAVYMKEGDPLYGTVYHVGDYLPDGTQFSGTNDEWEAFIKQDFRDRAEADGYDVYDDPDGDGFIIDLDGSYNPNN